MIRIVKLVTPLPQFRSPNESHGGSFLGMGLTGSIDEHNITRAELRMRTNGDIG